ncbi:MAG: transcriptional repressor [Pseudomonadota bacterium]
MNAQRTSDADETPDPCCAPERAPEGMAHAERICRERDAQFTPVRRRVLELMLESDRPIGAYALLDRLRADGLKAQPPTVYRALEFLIEQGLAHKIQMLNAYAACRRPGSRHAPHFMICTECHRVHEAVYPGIVDALDQAAKDVGFVTRKTALELAGICTSCSAKDTERGAESDK